MKRFLLGICFLLSLTSFCDSKFAQHEFAEELTPENFKSKVIDGKEVPQLVDSTTSFFDKF